jgi:hypothetical protein
MKKISVTDNENPNFIVTKAGSRPVKTAEDLRREAKEMFPENRTKVNFTSLIQKLKK